jgi:protein-L-isoaspartate(D-aspartate) O-methyltransferase
MLGPAAIEEGQRWLASALAVAGLEPRIRAAMERVPRHAFVPDAVERYAYEDCALPIGFDQTISQPTLVGLMTEKLDVQRGSKVLEIGTGSGYQAAILAELGCQVYTIEIVEPLAQRTAELLARLRYTDRVHLRTGDGYGGWPEEAPFDAAIFTAAAPRVPPPIVEQVAPGGRIVVPIEDELVCLVKKADGTLRSEYVCSVAFVPMVGEVRRN